MRKNPIAGGDLRRGRTSWRSKPPSALKQAQQDLNNKKRQLPRRASPSSRPRENKAKVTAERQRKIIDSMTLKAKTSGYVNIQQNTQSAT